MQSTLTARDADPHDAFVIEPDVVLAMRADQYEASRREPNLRALVSEISGVAAQATAPKVDTSFRAATVARPRSKFATSAIAAFLFALLSALAAAAWQRYGDEAQAMVVMVAPLLGLSSSQAPAEAVPSAAPSVAAAATDQAAASAEATAPAADGAAASPDPAEQIASLTRDLAAMGQQVEQLKTTIAALKAGQDQLTRDMKSTENRAAEAKPFEQTMRAKISALPPRPAPAKKPRPYVPPVQAAVAPPPPPPVAPAPVQVAPAPPPPPPPVATQPQDEPVLRPPMPVR